MITYRKASAADLNTLTELALRLYSGDNSYDSLLAENSELINNINEVIFLAFESGENNLAEKAVGFAHCSVRTDYVEGTEGGNVGYLEGIYVEPPYRMKGIAKSLLLLCEEWASGKDCAEFASDCLSENIDGYNFHIKTGFKEVNRLICFIKKLENIPEQPHSENGIKLGRYRHFKGNEYELIAVAKHTETFEDMAVYRALLNSLH